MVEERKGFKSFADLRKALGGEDEPEVPAPVSPSAEEDTEDALPERAYARELIAAMGTSFGPMETGPKCYRDEESEELELLATFRIRTIFPQGVSDEAALLPRDPAEADCAERVDLRGAVIFTIDGEDAKDFDDAISIEDHPEGGCEVGVHIADVSHYVRPGTFLDAEALARATSVYLPDQVIPMLPEALSNHLCSLVPQRDRLAYSVFMHFGADGTRRGTRIHKSVIRSVQRCTYRGVQKLLDGVDDETTRTMAHVAAPLRRFAEWTRRQQQLRDARGSLRLQSGERKFAFNEQHEVERIYRGETFFSQALIEETALAANQAVGDFFNDRRMPTIYRIHPEKDPAELAATIANLAKYGIRVPQRERLTGRDIGRLILQARRRPNPEASIARIMSLMERAVYELVPPGGEAP
ncbi:MAG: RNB domain-containing ribonuclease, partial [Planctomycetes bacterium]|nr:RNB domain-containing ribonuclease [Planctomycetota bacterium]